MINVAARVDSDSGSFFVKWKPDAPAGFFACEAAGLQRLREAGAFRTPTALAFHDEAPSIGDPPVLDAVSVGGAGPSFLILEFLPPSEPNDPAAYAQRFGRALAALHGAAFARGADGFGLDHSNYIGMLKQANDRRSCWADFYRDCRLLPQMEFARSQGRLPPERERLVMRVVDHLDTLLAGLDTRPALLHGDLWSGNILSAGEEPAVVDPAIYFGEREMEIAYMELFDGIPAGILDAYREAYPLDAGYARRRPLHQLYPLLVHLNHFGETYWPDVRSACFACLE